MEVDEAPVAWHLSAAFQSAGGSELRCIAALDSTTIVLLIFLSMVPLSGHEPFPVSRELIDKKKDGPTK